MSLVISELPDHHDRYSKYRRHGGRDEVCIHLVEEVDGVPLFDVMFACGTCRCEVNVRQPGVSSMRDALSCAARCTGWFVNFAEHSTRRVPPTVRCVACQ